MLRVFRFSFQEAEIKYTNKFPRLKNIPWAHQIIFGLYKIYTELLFKIMILVYNMTMFLDYSFQMLLNVYIIFFNF